MSENDSQRPQDADHAGETQQQPRVQVESTPADSNIPYVQVYDTQTGKPLGSQQVVNKHTVVKTKTKKLPIFITALAGCACGALLVIALIMSGALNIGGGKNAVTAGASGSSTQKITIDSEDTTLAEAVSAKALPSVVSITATSSGGQNGSLSQSADESDGSGSVGSGVVLDTEGHILTNNHVVDGYDQYVVTMDDGTTYEAEFVGNDASSDLAVIKLKDADASKLTPIEIGDSSKLNVGEWVMAIGSPFGNEQSVSTGIVSALYRSTAMSSTSGNTIYANMIQTDAAINPGNSGGALVNDNGELVGINSLIESYSGSSSGVGFAIPVNYAKNIADQIIDGKTPVHPYLGATLSSVNALNARTNKLSTDSGAYVASVVEDGPAAKAGIQEGDVITKLGDDEITSADGLIIALRSHEVRAVGGADLDEFGARSRHDVGDAEAAADLDKLAAADNDLLACGMGRQHQQHGGRVIVNDQRVLGTGKRADQLRGMLLARPTRAGVHTVLERAVAARDLGHGLCRRLRERGATQVGMDDHTRGVDGRTQARQCGSMCTPLDGRGQVALRARGGTGANSGALLVELGRDGGMHHRVAGLPRRLHYRPLGKQLVDGRNGAQTGAHLIGHVLAIAHVRPFKRNVDQSNASAESINRHYPRARQSFPRERRFPG